jgi:hypothetical protein
VYTAFHGSKLLTVKPNREERLDELQILELHLPDDIERMRAQRRKVGGSYRVAEAKRVQAFRSGG